MPHLAHAPMEPPAATVRIVNGKAEAWAGVQSPQAARDLVAKRLGMSPDDVTVNVTLLGGGFGRKSKPDYVVEAAVISQAMDGAPVKVTWTREDDIQHDLLPHRVGGAPRGRARRAGQAGGLAAPQRGADHRLDLRAGAKHELPFELGMGVINMPFAIPNVRIENPEADGAHAHRLVPLGLEHPARLRDPVASWPSWPRRRGGTRRTTCWS